jgi:integrase
MAKNPLHLIMIGSTWYYQRHVPPDVRAIIGRNKWRVSLKTTSIREAEDKRAVLDAKHRALIDAARGMSPAAKVTALEPRQWQSPELRAAAVSARDDLHKLADQRLTALDDGERAEVAKAGGITDFLANVSWAREGLPGMAASVSTWPRASQLHYEAQVREYEWHETICIKLGAMDPPTVAPEVETPDNPRLLAALETWLAMRSNPPDGSKPLSDGSTAKYRRHFKQFAELHGDLMLKAVTPAHVVAFADALAVAPNRKPLKSTADRLTFPELVELRRNDPTLAAFGKINENKVYDHLRALFRGVDRHDLAKAVPTRHVGRNERERVEGIPPGALRALFNELRKCDDRDLVMWCHLMAFSGLRPEEAAQLAPGNVVIDSGVYKLVIDDRDGRSLKNDASHRAIPVHPRLIELGFLDFVASAGAAPLLFSTFGSAPRDHLANAPSKRLKRFIDVVAPGGKSSANRLRHSYVDALRNARIDEPTQHYLTGHTSKHPIHAGYGSGVHLLTMLADVSRVDPLRDVTL